MSDLLSNAGTSLGQTMQGYGQDIQTASQGQYGPLIGRTFGQDAKGLFDKVMAGNDPTKDPYKPDQPEFDANGNYVVPQNKTATLISMMGQPKQANSRPMVMPQAMQGIPAMPQMPTQQGMDSQDLMKLAMMLL